MTSTQDQLRKLHEDKPMPSPGVVPIPRHRLVAKVILDAEHSLNKLEDARQEILVAFEDHRARAKEYLEHCKQFDKHIRDILIESVSAIAVLFLLSISTVDSHAGSCMTVCEAGICTTTCR